ncbi:hypothetical protein, partial [Pseudoalteromonas sp. S1609]|uniref:hypothetical protein n=1 Tax=Pseudoalteromonas sp. S1609 TaxID=579505 RepID=UPI001BB295D8
AFICFTILASVSNERGHPLESSGQAGSCVFLIFLFKNQVFSSFKLILNMAKNLKRRVCWNCADRVEAAKLEVILEGLQAS